MSLLSFIFLVSVSANLVTSQETSNGTEFMCPSPGLFPNPTDCHKFYFCFKNEDGDLQFQLIKCPEGMFSAMRNTCVPEDTGKECQEAPSFSPLAPRVASISNCDGGPTCSDDCSKAVLCFKNAEGIEKNVDLQYCGYDWHCYKGECMPGSPERKCNTEMFQCPETLTSFPDFQNCSKYYQCDESGVSPTHRVCKSSQVFNPDLDYLADPCSYNGYADCRTIQLPDDICTSASGPMAIPNYCRYFYRCVADQNGGGFKVVVGKCRRYDEGFDPASRQCVYLGDNKDCAAEIGRCAAQGVFQPTKYKCTGTYYYCGRYQYGGFIPIAQECSRFKIFNPKSNQCTSNVSDCAGVCGAEDGFYPVENDCSSFYICMNGLKGIDQCANGLVFNPKNQKCDFPRNVPSCTF